MRADRCILSTMIAVASLTILAHAEDQMPWQPNLETARQVATQTNRLVLIHFWAPRCEPCMRVEKEVFSRPETARALEANFVLVKLNAWDDAPGTARLYGVTSLPTDVIIAPSGRLISQVQSPQSANQYVAQMNQAAAGYRELVRSSTSQIAAAPQATMAPAAAAPAATTPTVTPAAATTPIASASPAATAIASYSPTDPAAASAPTAQPAGQPASSDRYAEYFRQHPQAAPPATAPQAAAAPTASAPAAAAPPVAYVATQPSAPPVNVAPAAPPTAPGVPPIAPAQAPSYITGPANPPVNAAAAAPAPPQVQLPPGCPPAGLYGYCPVTLVESKQWAQGDKAYGAVHRGRTYLFLGPAEKEKFLANPDRYSPVLGGNDPVLALDNQIVVAGRRETGVFGPDGRIYMFADESSLARFNQNPKRYAPEAVQAMR